MISYLIARFKAHKAIGTIALLTVIILGALGIYTLLNLEGAMWRDSGEFRLVGDDGGSSVVFGKIHSNTNPDITYTVPYLDGLDHHIVLYATQVTDGDTVGMEQYFFRWTPTGGHVYITYVGKRPYHLSDFTQGLTDTANVGYTWSIITLVKTGFTLIQQP